MISPRKAFLWLPLRPFYFLIFFSCVQQEENLLDVLQLVLSIMTEQPDTCIPVFDKVDGLR